MPNSTGMMFHQLLNEAHHDLMNENQRLICYGLGINDPGRVFNTTKGLVEAFGNDRVFDTPNSENALTGIGIGAAMAGTPVIMCHQRQDFALVSMDQIINAAAKWHFMFGGAASIPITIRMIIGRGWGQGPTHSQSLQSLFAHVPGLKVVMPSLPNTVKPLFKAAVKDPNPVIFLEHRWLHNIAIIEEYDNITQMGLGSATKLADGDRITIVSMSFQTILALKAREFLKARGVDVDLIDLNVIRPMDYQTIFKSIQKTGNLLVLDTSHERFSVASEVVSAVTQNCFVSLKAPPIVLAKPNFHEPTSFGLTKNYYNSVADIILSVNQIIGCDITDDEIPERLKSPSPHDIPGDWFTGPF